MHRPAFRSALEHSARGVLLPASSTSASGPARPAAAAVFFSTTSVPSGLKWLPTSKERQAAAASELSSLDSNNNTAAAPAGAAPVSPFSKEAPIGGTTSAAASSSNQIINVRSLPRSLSGGGPRFPGTGVSAGALGGGRFRASVEGGGGGNRRPGGFNLRGSRNGRSDNGGRNRTAARPARARRAQAPKEKKQEAKRAEGLTEEQEQELYVEAREWLHFHEFGTPTAFEPALTREGLLGFNPAVPTSASGGAAGHLATALRSMRLVAGGTPFTGTFEPGESHTYASPNPEGVRDQLRSKKNEAVFFDSLVERVRTEQALRSKRALAKLKAAGLPADTSLIKAPSAVTKAAILEAAVRGVYAAPGPVSATTTGTAAALLDTTHRYQAKDNTYSPAKARQFEAKILELLPKEAAAAGNGGAQAKRA